MDEVADRRGRCAKFVDNIIHGPLARVFWEVIYFICPVVAIFYALSSWTANRLYKLKSRRLLRRYIDAKTYGRSSIYRTHNYCGGGSGK